MKSDKYTQMGMAALLPGMVHMVELMQRQLDEFKEQLAIIQGGDSRRGGQSANATAEGRRRSAAAVKNYWAKMTPEERSAESKRRQRKRKANMKKEGTRPGRKTAMQMEAAA